MHPRAAVCSRAVRAASLRLGASSRSPARPRRRPRAPQPGPASKPARALRSLRCPPHQRCLAAVVPPVGIAGASRVAISGRSFACCYKRRQSDGVFAENSGFWAQIDDVCNVVRPRAPQPGRVGQLGRLSETVVAFAGAGRASTETAIAFAGAKWVFVVHFLGAEAKPVSRLPCWGRAVVMVVSMVAVQGRAVVLLVSTSPRCRASCVKKFALHAHIGPKWAFSGVLGELFRRNVAEGGALGEFFADRQAWDPTGRVCCNSVLAAGPSTGSVNPSMRSYTHRVEAGRGRPTTPATDPATQSVDKGK